MAAADLARALSAWPELGPLAEQLLQHYPGLVPGQHRLLLEGGRLTLDLWWEDVADALPDLAGHGRRCGRLVPGRLRAGAQRGHVAARR